MIAKQITAALCLLWQFFNLSSCSIGHMKYRKLKVMNWGLPLAGHKFNVTPIATSKATNHMKCMTQCTKTDGCAAINLGPLEEGKQECEMLNITRHLKLHKKFTPKPGWTYIGPKVL